MQFQAWHSHSAVTGEDGSDKKMLDFCQTFQNLLADLFTHLMHTYTHMQILLLFICVYLFTLSDKLSFLFLVAWELRNSAFNFSASITLIGKKKRHRINVGAPAMCVLGINYFTINSTINNIVNFHTKDTCSKDGHCDFNGQTQLYKILNGSDHH